MHNEESLEQPGCGEDHNMDTEVKHDSPGPKLRGQQQLRAVAGEQEHQNQAACAAEGGETRCWAAVFAGRGDG